MPIKQLITYYPDYSIHTYTELSDGVEVSYEEYEYAFDGKIKSLTQIRNNKTCITQYTKLGGIFSYLDDLGNLIQYTRYDKKGNAIYHLIRKSPNDKALVWWRRRYDEQDNCQESIDGDQNGITKRTYPI